MIEPGKETWLLEEYDWILRKLQRVYGKGLAWQDIVSLNPAVFQRRWGVGRKSVRRLHELQRELRRLLPVELPRGKSVPGNSPDGVTPENCAVAEGDRPVAFNLARFRVGQARALRKLARAMGCNSLLPEELMALSDKELRCHSGVGAKTLEALKELKQHVWAEWRAPRRDWIQNPGIFQWFADRELEPAEVDRALVEDLEHVLGTLSERPRKVVQGRLGYGTTVRTFMDLGKEEGVSRETIRQIDLRTWPVVQRASRFSPAVLSDWLDSHYQDDIMALLPRFAGGFSSPEQFCRLLETWADWPEGKLRNQQLLDSNVASTLWLGELFATTPAPVGRDDLESAMADDFDLTPPQSRRLVALLQARGWIRVVGDEVHALRLSRRATVAHVLATRPRGLSWRGVMEAISGRWSESDLGYQKTYISALQGRWTYAYGQGVQRHLLYFDVPVDVANGLLREIARFMSRSEEPWARLVSVYEDVAADSGVDYYDVRHLLIERGEEYGLYFYGRSNLDIVTTERWSEPRPTCDEIYQLLDRSSGPLSVAQMLNMVARRNERQLARGLRRLIRNRRVVRVNSIQYWTAEQALASVDLDRLARALVELAGADERPMEMSTVRQQLCPALELWQPTHWYASVAQFLSPGSAAPGAPGGALHVCGAFVSRAPFVHETLPQVVRACARPGMAASDHAAAVHERIRAGQAVVNRAVQRYRIWERPGSERQHGPAPGTSQRGWLLVQAAGRSEHAGGAS